jgi:putative flippase GtrA
MFLIKYALFALIATLVNLSTQYPIFWMFKGEWVIYLALFVGTLTGLVTKYWLDKRWIFYYVPTSKIDDFSRFSLYALMGIFTTVIFWGTELFFFKIFNFKHSQYVGGALGLLVGYFIKYLLDRKFVFNKAPA